MNDYIARVLGDGVTPASAAVVDAARTRWWKRYGATMLGLVKHHDVEPAHWVSRGGSDLTRGVPTAINSYLTAASTPFFYKPNSVPNPVTGLSGAKDAANC